MSVTSQAPKAPVTKPSPALPNTLMNLPLKGFKPAVYAAPRSAKPSPWPLIVILHGNYDRPEWECDWWLRSARPHGWLLCPRGVRRPGVPRSLDRWTYAGITSVAREIRAGLDGLHLKYPKLISEKRALLIGFSLGAIYATRVMQKSRVQFSHAILVEGGASPSLGQIRWLKKRGLARVAYLCARGGGCGRRAKNAARLWKRAGVEARLWIMPTSHHGYSDNFDPLGREVFRWLLAIAP